MLLNRYLALFFSLPLLFLAGCATFQSSTPTSGQNCGRVNTAKLEAIQKWHISGALAVKAQQTGGNASFNWQQNGKQYSLELFGPFGINRIRLVGMPTHVTLFDHQAPRTATTPEVLLQQQLGWSVPVSHLLYWIRGLPVPNIPIEQVQKLPNGTLSHLAQQGWLVRYLDYTQIGCTILPAKLFITHPTLQLRLVIRQWQLL